ncbi:unnamed protein product [Linum tenue]|uniref:Uncharacterized protein n=1 Tax=Linum tenue TaxID=586396 RepID=A0AAV0HLW2_9ROSI|nr:unnamed protein product [Linum tenue]
MIHHCMTLVWLWNGDGQAPAGLLTGIASFVRAYAGLTPAAGSKTTTTTRFGDGERWDQGYEVTANFLIYCEALRHRFVPELNGKLKYGYADGLFHDLTGKTVEELWKDYKTEFGTRLISNTVTNYNNNNEISY